MIRLKYMTLKQRLKIAAATSLIWIICLSSCAGLNITTWFLDGKEHLELIRKNADGSILASKTFLEAHGFLCYSPSDDEAWRTQFATYAECCNAK